MRDGRGGDGDGDGDGALYGVGDAVTKVFTFIAMITVIVHDTSFRCWLMSDVDGYDVGG